MSRAGSTLIPAPPPRPRTTGQRPLGLQAPDLCGDVCPQQHPEPRPQCFLGACPVPSIPPLKALISSGMHTETQESAYTDTNKRWLKQVTVPTSQQNMTQL